MSGIPPIATELRTLLEVGFVPICGMRLGHSHVDCLFEDFHFIAFTNQ